MTFLTRTGSSRTEDLGRAAALLAWRETAELVRERWELCLAADRRSRPFMFAAYHAALDREAAAADALSRYSLRPAA